MDATITTAKNATTPATIGHINPDEVVLMTIIMAANREIPKGGGWWGHSGYAGATQRLNGVLGEVVHTEDTVYVCVREDTALRLPNHHPDYRPSCGTAWVAVPRPEAIDWRFVPTQYHSRTGWRVK